MRWEEEEVEVEVCSLVVSWPGNSSSLNGLRFRVVPISDFIMDLM